MKKPHRIGWGPVLPAYSVYFVDLVIAWPTLLMSSPAPATVLAQPAISRQPSKASEARILVPMADSFL